MKSRKASKTKKFLQLMIIKAYNLAILISKDKKEYFRYKKILENAIFQTFKIRKIFYLIILHELERRTNSLSGDLLDIKKNLLEECKKKDREEIFDMLKILIDDSIRDHTMTTSRWESNKKMEIENYEADISEHWFSDELNFSYHFNLLGFEYPTMTNNEVDFINNTKFSELLSKHNIKF